MGSVTLSSKFQVVIPQEIREKIGLEAGTKLEILAYDSRIELIPIHSIKNLHGLFKGINTDIVREEDRI